MNFRDAFGKFASYIIPFLVIFSMVFPQQMIGAEPRVFAGEKGSYRAGRVLVQFRSPSVTLEDATRRVFSQAVVGLQAVPLHVERVSHIRKEAGARYLLSFSSSLDPSVIAAQLLKRPDVLSASPDYWYHQTQTFDDPDFHLSDGLYNVGSNSGRSGGLFDADVDAEQAWGTTRGSGAIIAVVDSGVDINHPDLAANIWTNTSDPVNGSDDDSDGFIDDNHGWDFVAFDYSDPGTLSRPGADSNLTADNDPTPEPNNVDEDQDLVADDGAVHGTHVAGIAAARADNAEGTVGVAPEATIMPLRALDDEGNGDSSQILDAMDFAIAHGADIINMSFSTGPLVSADPTFNAVVESAWDNGVVLVAAAGNNSNDLSFTPESPVVNDCGTSCGTDSNKIIGVAALTNADTLASYSNYSSSANYVDVAAPGGALTANRQIYSTTYKNLSYDCCQTDYGYESGTSMATPVVSGIAALLRAENPSMTVLQIRDRIRNTVDALSVSNIGTGRVNAAHALNNSPVVRSFGASRYDTAISTSVLTYPEDASAASVVLASGQNFPDGLGASALARVKNAPLLLTQQGSLPSGVLNEINRVLGSKSKPLYLVGGTAAIGTAVESALAGDGFTNIVRISGSDRVDTAVAVASEVSPGSVGSVVMVNKDNFPDALSAAAVVAKRSVPLFLNAQSGLSAANRTWFLLHSVSRVYLVGGTSVLSDAVVSDLANVGISAVRLSGSDRYATSAEVAKCFFSTTSSSPCNGVTTGRVTPKMVTAALGTNFPDALSGGPYAGFYSGPLLLVQGSTVPSSIASYVASIASSVRDGMIFGGTSVVSNTASASLAAQF